MLRLWQQEKVILLRCWVIICLSIAILLIVKLMRLEQRCIWLLWMGLLFVLSVYYFPTGVVGRLRARTEARALARQGVAPALKPHH